VRKLLVIVAVAVLALVAAPVALADNGHGGGNKAKGKSFTCHGKVVATDVVAKTVTLDLQGGSKGLRRFRGKEFTVQVADTAKIVRNAYGESTTVTLADIKEGERIWVRGTTATGDGVATYTATAIKLKATWPFSAQGTVVLTDTATGTITVTVSKSAKALKPLVGQDVIFQSTATTIFKKCVDDVVIAITFADIVPGDKVVLGGTVDKTAPVDEQLILKRVLVKG